jgi:hypothetical protein
VARKSTLDVFRAVVLKTPVDTGRAKGNWQVSHGAPDTSLTERKDTTPLGKIGAEMAAVVQKADVLPVGGVNYLSNSLPYIVRLEHGWSKAQAPAGMVRISALEYEDYVRKAIASK